MNIEHHEWSVPVHCTCTVYEYNLLTKLLQALVISHRGMNGQWPQVTTAY